MFKSSMYRELLTPGSGKWLCSPLYGSGSEYRVHELFGWLLCHARSLETFKEGQLKLMVIFHLLGFYVSFKKLTWFYGKYWGESREKIQLIVDMVWFYCSTTWSVESVWTQNNTLYSLVFPHLKYMVCFSALFFIERKASVHNADEICMKNCLHWICHTVWWLSFSLVDRWWIMLLDSFILILET